MRALDDQRVFELGQRGENTEHETTVCRRGVELRALARQDLQADPAPGQVMDEIDQVAQVAAEPVEFPRDQRIALPQRLEAYLQTRPIIALAGRRILVEVSRFDTGGISASRCRSSVWLPSAFEKRIGLASQKWRVPNEL